MSVPSWCLHHQWMAEAQVWVRTAITGAWEGTLSDLMVPGALPTAYCPFCGIPKPAPVIHE